MAGRLTTLALIGALALASGCGGTLVRLAKQERWAELDQEARSMKSAPRGKAAQAWARALVELDKVDEARAVLLRDFRTGGREPSLLQLAALEHELGLDGMAAAHFGRLLAIDDGDLRESPSATQACELFRRRAQALLQLDEPLAADADLRRLSVICPDAITDADRELLAAIRPQAEARARAQRTLEGLEANPEPLEQIEARLAEQLELARKRSPRAVVALADREGMQLAAEDVAVLLAAELAGALGPGLVSSRRLSAWVGDNSLDELVAAIETLPDGVREYAYLRLAGVRDSDRLADEREPWIVAAMASLEHQGPQEGAKAWRVAASAGDLAGAELALNTNLRKLVVRADPAALGGPPKPGSVPGEPTKPASLAGPTKPWWLEVPVDRQSFDLLLTLARLFELRGKPADALTLRRHVIASGYRAGLVQVGEVVVEEVRRQLVLGHVWHALALAEVVPGPLVDELLPVVASALALAQAVGVEHASEDRQAIERVLGEEWFSTWQPRLDAAGAGLDLAGPTRGSEWPCPEPSSWFDPEREAELRAVGLDPEASRAALLAALDQPGSPASGQALARALEADVALACSGPVVIPLLHAGLHELTIATLDERLVQAPELDATMQLQLHAELALAHGEGQRAALLTTSAAGLTDNPRALWARAAVAGRSYGAREYTLEALRQVLLHSDGLQDTAARRELVLTRLRDVDLDEQLRERDEAGLEELSRGVIEWLGEAPPARRWRLMDELLWQLAREPRADALASELLAEVLLSDAVRRSHPAAVAALEQADTPVDAPKLADSRELAFLSDAEALCELAREPGEPTSAMEWIGVASACSPRRRAEALAALLASVPPGAEGAPQRAALRERLLAGPLAAVVEEGAPGNLAVEPALARPGLLVRVLFGLSLEPAWIVDADALAGSRDDR